ncbi:hypothetical protein [Asticcacaulis sp. W401b]|uniref:hypothetical protein n=1 Tax=Asticcacaulis sp. W401b TaxID=3388666 RepID=UPI0039705D94
MLNKFAFFIAFMATQAHANELAIYESNGTTVAVRWETQQAIQVPTGLSRSAINGMLSDEEPNIKVEDSGASCRNQFLEYDFARWKSIGDFEIEDLVFKRRYGSPNLIEVYRAGELIYEYLLTPKRGVVRFSYYEGPVAKYVFKLKAGRGFLSQCKG